MQIGIEIEVLLYAEIFIEAEALRHVSDPVLDGLRVERDIDTQDLELAFINFQQSGCHSQQCRLSRSIRAHQGG